MLRPVVPLRLGVGLLSIFWLLVCGLKIAQALGGRAMDTQTIVVSTFEFAAAVLLSSRRTVRFGVLLSGLLAVAFAVNLWVAPARPCHCLGLAQISFKAHLVMVALLNAAVVAMLRGSVFQYESEAQSTKRGHWAGPVLCLTLLIITVVLAVPPQPRTGRT